MEQDGASIAAYRGTLLGRLDERTLNHRTARVALALLLGAALIIPSIQFVIKIQETEPSLWRTGGERHRTALGRWLPTAELLTDPRANEHPYGYGHWFPTPPMVLLSLVPLTKLGYTGAGIVWAILKLGGFLLTMSLVIRGLGRAAFAVPLGVIAMAGIFSIRPIVSDLTHGNLNIFMAIWLGLAWAMYVRGKDLWAGLFVAIAIVTKLTPALVLVYFAYKRAWRVCLGTIVGLVFVFVLIPGGVLGFERNLDYLGTWFEMIVAPFALEGYATKEIANQSLFGVALRLLSNAGLLSIEYMPDDRSVEVGMEFMARPATFWGGLLKPALSVPVLAALAWSCRTKRASRRDPRRLLELGMVLVAMLLLSERTWKHHATTLPLVYLGVWYALTCVRLTDRFRAWFVAGLIAQFFLLVATSAGFLPERMADKLLDGGFFCWGLVLCFIQIAVLLATLNRNA